MNKFHKAFAEPLPFWHDGDLVISAESYSREEAAAKIGEVEEIDVKPESLREGWVRFHLGIDERGDLINQWWLYYWPTGRGSKPVWVLEGK